MLLNDSHGSLQRKLPSCISRRQWTFNTDGWEIPLRSPWWVWDGAASFACLSWIDIKKTEVSRLKGEAFIMVEWCQELFLTRLIAITFISRVYCLQSCFKTLSSWDVRCVQRQEIFTHRCPRFCKLWELRQWLQGNEAEGRYTPTPKEEDDKKVHISLFFKVVTGCVSFHQIGISVPFTWCFYSAVTLSWFDSSFKNSRRSIRHLVSRKPMHFTFRLHL